MREPFILFRRPDGAKNGRMWYVEFWDSTVPPSGKYINRASVGRLLTEIEDPGKEGLDPCKKGDARAVVDLWRQSHTPTSGAALLPFLESFWLEDGEYSKRYARDHRSKKGLSDEYLYNNRKNIKNHLKPFLEEHRRAGIGIGQVTPKLLNEYKAYLEKKELADSTMNSAIKAVFVPVNDFWLQAGAPDKSPAKLVSYVPVEEFERDILSVAEAARVFQLAELSQRDRLLLQLSAFAGLRVSEACASRPEYLTLESFDTPDGKVEYYTFSIVEQAKKGAIGEAVLPFALGQELLEFYKATWGEGWLFDGKMRGSHIQKKEAELVSNGAILKALEITDEERVARGLTFHAWRHWYITHVRAATDRDLAQKLARHKSAKMTDHYTHLTIEERQESALAVGAILGKVK